MGTSFKVHCYTPLDRETAKRLVDNINALMERYDDEHLRPQSFDASAPDELDGLSVVTAADLTAGNEDDSVGISDDFAVVVERDAPPTVAEATARAQASRHATKVDPRALERLPDCRTTITMDFAARAGQTPFGVGVQRHVLSASGASVVASEDGSELLLVEDELAKLANEPGSRWLDKALHPHPRGERRKRAPRAAKPGEVESVRLRALLDQGIADPFVASRLQTELRATTAAVRDYAALLVEEGAMADARAARAIGCTASALASTRDELDHLLSRARRGG
jgi:hypothetical protein